MLFKPQCLVQCLKHGRHSVRITEGKNVQMFKTIQTFCWHNLMHEHNLGIFTIAEKTIQLFSSAPSVFSIYYPSHFCHPFSSFCKRFTINEFLTPIIRRVFDPCLINHISFALVLAHSSCEFKCIAALFLSLNFLWKAFLVVFSYLNLFHFQTDTTMTD